MASEIQDWVNHSVAGGRYRVTAKLGQGGMGYVYRAHDRNLDTEVVIKVPRRAMLLDDPSFADRFGREIRSLVKLSHPHIVKITDVGEHEGLPFAIMQYMDGGSLDDRRPVDAQGNPRAIRPEGLKGWLEYLAKALDFIHKRGYVHRDVKPANILFDADKNVYLSDFGIVKALEGETDGKGTSSLTGTGMVLGTPEYMAPEVIMGQEYDGRADQYALAVIVHELLCGHLPFEGPTPAAVLVKQSTAAPPNLHEVSRAVSPEMAEVVARGLSKDPSDRYGDCASFSRAVVEVRAAPARQRKQTGSALAVGTQSTSISVACPACGKRLQLPKVAGKSVSCPGCGRVSQLRRTVATGSSTAVAAAPEHSVVSPVDPGNSPCPAVHETEAGGIPHIETPPVGMRSTQPRPRNSTLGPVLVAAFGGVILLFVVLMIWLVARSFSEYEGLASNDQVEPKVELEDKRSEASSHDDPFGLPEPSESRLQKEPPDPLVAPFGPSEAREKQSPRSVYLNQPKTLTNSIGMKLKLISAGEFMMGSPEDEEDRNDNECPQHRVRITKSFYLGVHEVTQEQYEQVMGENPSSFEGSTNPVEQVSWKDAVAFCRKLSAREGRTYRLPTEAEWEYACRAGTTTPFHFGRALNGTQANCHGGYPYGTETKGPDLGKTTTVGSYPANAFGLYDMHGNVWEWCQDWYDADYYEKSLTDDTAGPFTGSGRVNRGGGWNCDPRYCRSAIRAGNTPDGRGIILGFRVVQALGMLTRDNDPAILDVADARSSPGRQEVDLSSAAASLPESTAVASRSPAKASSPREPLTEGQWIDILGPADIERDSYAALLHRHGSEIMIRRSNTYGRLTLPLFVDGNYDVEVIFTPRINGASNVFVILPVGTRQCMAILRGGSASRGRGCASRGCGLAMIDSKREFANPTFNPRCWLSNGRRYVVAISVREADDAVKITVSINGGRCISWQGKSDSLSLLPCFSLPHAGRLGLGAWLSDVTFHSARFRLSSGQAYLFSNDEAIPEN